MATQPVNVLNTAELLALKQLALHYVNFTSVNVLKGRRPNGGGASRLEGLLAMFRGL